MRFDLVTLFPELFAPLLSSGITRRAFETGQVDVRLNNPRDFSAGNYKRVDDRPYGGGPGMVMMAEPLARCIESIRLQRPGPVPVVLFSPLGRLLDQATVASWATSEGAVLICGRYEGLDQRFIDQYVTHQVSLGDFVMSGGEIAAMALLDAVARLQPGVLNTAASHQQDSFSPELDGLLDCPHYTRPQHWAGQAVPEVLMSGNHLDIAQWLRRQRLWMTLRLRPDLIARAREGGRLSLEDEAFLLESGTDNAVAATRCG